MSHFCNRSKVSTAAVAGLPSVAEKMEFVRQVAPGAVARANAQIHQPRSRNLKPPSG